MASRTNDKAVRVKNRRTLTLRIESHVRDVIHLSTAGVDYAVMPLSIPKCGGYIYVGSAWSVVNIFSPQQIAAASPLAWWLNVGCLLGRARTP
jgi:hypothetical protein